MVIFKERFWSHYKLFGYETETSTCTSSKGESLQKIFLKVYEHYKNEHSFNTKFGQSYFRPKFQQKQCIHVVACITTHAW